MWNTEWKNEVDRMTFQPAWNLYINGLKRNFRLTLGPCDMKWNAEMIATMPAFLNTEFPELSKLQRKIITLKWHRVLLDLEKEFAGQY